MLKNTSFLHYKDNTNPHKNYNRSNDSSPNFSKIIS